MITLPKEQGWIIITGGNEIYPASVYITRATCEWDEPTIWWYTGDFAGYTPEEDLIADMEAYGYVMIAPTEGIRGATNG